MGTIPPDFKLVTPYLTRATELSKAEPVMSYWCTYYSVQQAISIGSKSPESNVFLFGLMDKLEAMKAELATNEAVNDDAAASAFVSNFAVKIFAQADNEDRTGKATRLTAKKFLASANFLELLSIFGEVPIEDKEKIKYSKWKAADIAKAFREGRNPTPGPAGGLPVDETTENLNGAQVTSEEEKELTRELAAMAATDDTKRDYSTDRRMEGSEKDVKSVTPGAIASAPPAESPREDEDFAESYPFPQQPTTEPRSSREVIDIDNDVDELSAASFNKPQLTHSSETLNGLPGVPDPFPPPTHQTAELAPPPVSSISPAPQVFPSAVFTSAPPLPPPAATAPFVPPPLPPPPIRPPQSQSQLPRATPPPPAAAPAARFASAVPNGNSSSSTVLSPSSSSSLPASLDPMVIGAIQKHAKWAISALNYEDLDTARKELKAALLMLEGSATA